ncbi:methylmalonyl Co-A mutase-associated GTPase MeaB [Engelhardtia mirabilis]|uniref:Putative GTPase n=1 Tax=Engelhardtia mirabilis TaxID=2528011 RepID=A0A518BKV2_9BACT|nr:putative GTPase [Planctomycetes bacterium Pla133]QDV01909.1 putative GTPase [Planctomycetes bacterium Pla86]
MSAEVSEALRLAEGVRAGDRALIGRAVTLVESRAAKHEAGAAELLRALLPSSGGAHRVGISGVPGVGKSTFIEALGLHLVERGHRVAVLAVDPSSTITGGSILGDKSRMNALAMHAAAFVRPSPSAATLGGVARRTREAMVVLEAAGYDVVLVETVGVGQSETAVAEMVDTFCVLLLPGAGDELQGIKKGIVEHADLIVVNKADGENRARAEAARAEYDAALHYLRPRRECWRPRTLLASALERTGLEEVWETITEHRAALEGAGVFEANRIHQRKRWMWSHLEEALVDAFRTHPAVRAKLDDLERRVGAAELPASEAARELLRAFGL